MGNEPAQEGDYFAFWCRKPKAELRWYRTRFPRRKAATISLKTMKIKREQTICEWVGVKPIKPEAGSKVGIALDTIGKNPINGLRHKPEKGTNGWYIWCGEEFSNDDEFFSPLHIEHMNKYLPEVVEYLDLPPGYRFLIDGNNWEDVWYDEDILKG